MPAAVTLPEEIAKPYYQGWADARGTGTRWGPVHLFTDPFPNPFPKVRVPLCGRVVKRWNFEGKTTEDFCVKCLRLAREAAA